MDLPNAHDNHRRGWFAPLWWDAPRRGHHTCLPTPFFFAPSNVNEQSLLRVIKLKLETTNSSHAITRGPRKPAQPPLRARQGGHHQKFLLQDSIDSTHSLRLGENVDVIEECEIPLIIPAWPREQDAVPQINGSPSSPPSPWLIVCTVPESSSHR